MEVVCFHNPDEENGYLSNWYPSRFRFEGITYSSMEQYMMHRKALCFGDGNTASLIMATQDVAEIKRLGRCVSHYDDKIWDGIRQIVVYEGLFAKFAQNCELAAMLHETGDLLLAECAKNDLIWGIGLSMQDPRRNDISEWRGRNLLGFTLAMVRSKLESEIGRVKENAA